MSSRIKTMIALLALLAAAVCVPAVASANDEAPPAGASSKTVGFEVLSVDNASRTLRASAECVVETRIEGRAFEAKIGADVDLEKLEVGGHRVGVFDTSTSPPTLVRLVDGGCQRTEPKPEPRPERPDKPDCDRDDDVAGAATSSDDDNAEDKPGCDRRERPVFKGGFLNRVWRFVGEANSYRSGVLNMTVARVLNLPRKYRTQDDELLDEDANVLVGSKTRVYRDGKRVAADRLDDAELVRVHGKLLPPSKWQEDEDGTATPTIRAKKVYVLD